MATSAERERALPARHLPPDSNAQSRKSASASPPFLPTHDEKGVQPIGTQVPVAAYQLKIIAPVVCAKATRNCLRWIQLNTTAVLCSHDIAVKFMNVFPL